MSTQPNTQSNTSRSTFASRLVAPLLVGLAFILSGCGPKITIAWDSPKSEVGKDTKLCLAGVEVGQVTDVRSEYGRFMVGARLNRKRAPEVKAESTFLVHPAQSTGPAYIEVISPVADSPSVKDGAILHGSDTEAGAQVRALVGKGKSEVLIILLGAAVLAVFARIFIRLAATIFCLGAGLAGAYFAAPYAQPHWARLLPADFRPDLLAYGASFLLAYLLALFAVTSLRSPAAAVRP